MNYKEPLLSIQEKSKRDFDKLNDFPTLADLMRNQKVNRDKKTLVHRRRDLDSLG